MSEDIPVVGFEAKERFDNLASPDHRREEYENLETNLEYDAVQTKSIVESLVKDVSESAPESWDREQLLEEIKVHRRGLVYIYAMLLSTKRFRAGKLR